MPGLYAGPNRTMPRLYKDLDPAPILAQVCIVMARSGAISRRCSMSRFRKTQSLPESTSREEMLLLNFDEDSLKDNMIFLSPRPN